MRRAALAFGIALVACRGERRATPAVDEPSQPAPPVGGPARAARPLTPALLDRLAALAVPAHQVAVVGRGAGDLALAVTAADGTRALVTASTCLGCVPVALEAWRARRAELAALWAPGAEAEPPATEARLAIEVLALPAEPAIVLDARRADGATVTVAHWNDGATQLQAVCEAPAAACRGVVTAALTAALAALR